MRACQVVERSQSRATTLIVWMIPLPCQLALNDKVKSVDRMLVKTSSVCRFLGTCFLIPVKVEACLAVVPFG